MIKVVYLGNAASNPSSNPVGGCVLYSNSGAFVTRDTGGLMTLGDGSTVDMVLKATASAGIEINIGATNYVFNTSGNSQGLIFSQANDAIVVGGSGGAPAISFSTPDSVYANVGLVPGSLNPTISGKNNVYVGNSNTIPTANPTSGFYLYSNSGVATVRNSSGVITTLGLN